MTACGDITIICTICGAMSETNRESEAHFKRYHAGRDWQEDPVMVRFAHAMFRAYGPSIARRIAQEVYSH